jgi:ATP-binding protein involved in chromosome partitioning
MVQESQILEVLGQIQDPDLSKDIVSLGFVKDIKIQGANVAFTIQLSSPASPARKEIEERATQLVADLPGVDKAFVHMSAEVPAAKSLLAENSVPGVKNLIAVSSGKGGVGKSTVAVNLACALAKSGARVGILDADVYGPNVPIMLGVSGRPEVINNKIQPRIAHGVKVMSMAFLLEEDQPVIWRGPMLHGAIKQFVSDVEWGETDYLVVDLPPGTGDAQLSLAQQTHLMGSIIVTTPQEVSVLDVRKAINMFKQVNVPVLGVVENMSGMALQGKAPGASKVTIDGPEGPISADCDAEGQFQMDLDLFGSGGGAKISEQFDVPLLGRIPLDPSVRLGGDRGLPAVMARAESLVAERFMEVASQLAGRVSQVNLG